ncbi:MAG: hypothetical protein AAF492_17285, partial [Verrucomicrobiota bacterium]
NDVWVHWGDTDGGTNAAAWSNSVQLGTFTNLDTDFSFALTGLTDNVDYYFTFQAVNCINEFWGDPGTLTFKTQGPPVVDNDGGAREDIGQADLRGELTGGVSANATIYWGDTDGGTDPAMWQNVTNIGFVTEGLFSATVTGLYYGVRYYYRTFASNDIGTAWANATTNFKTLRPSPFGGGDGLSVKVYDTTFGISFMDPVSNLMNVTETAIYFETNDLDYSGFGEFDAAFPALTGGSQYSILWEGVMIIKVAGDYSFGTSSDDGSMFYIDLNHDGDFVDPGERVVDNNGNHGTRSETGGANLPVGCYRIAIPFYENGGGETMEARWGFGAGLSYGAMSFVNGSSNEFAQICPGSGFAITNTVADNFGPASADANGMIDIADAVFDVLAYWGGVDGGTNESGWSNVVFAGSYTNVTNFNVTAVLNGLSLSNIYYTLRMTNCLESFWAQPSVLFAFTNLVGDSDGDGMSDVAEMIANTDPLDPNSFLWVTIDTTADQLVRNLSFPASTGRTFRIERSTDLFTGTWTTVRMNIPGTNAWITIPDTNSAERVYYRIGVESP